MPAKGKNKRLKQHQETFRRHWFAAFRNVAACVENGITPGELRLAMRILDASLFKGRLTVRIANDRIEKAANLTRSPLYAARSALVGLHIINATKDGEEHWIYQLLNPATGQSFPGESGADDPVTIDDDWGKFTF